jgi:hypothetical protein
MATFDHPTKVESEAAMIYAECVAPNGALKVPLYEYINRLRTIWVCSLSAPSEALRLVDKSLLDARLLYQDASRKGDESGMSYYEKKLNKLNLHRAKVSQIVKQVSIDG